MVKRQNQEYLKKLNKTKSQQPNFSAFQNKNCLKLLRVISFIPIYDFLILF